MTDKLQANHIFTIVVLLLLSLPGPVSAGVQPTPQLLDNRSALKFSQGAIGQVLGDHLLVDAASGTIRLSAYRGKPLVISQVYTSCYHICPTTTRHLAKVIKTAQAALGTNSFNIVTIGFDAVNDTPEAMRKFARHQDVDVPGWKFLSADQATITRLSRNLGFQFVATPKGFDHLIQATVIDAGGRVYRQVYGMNFNTPLLVEPLKELVLDNLSSGSLLTSVSDRIRLLCTVYDPASGKYHVDYSLFVGMFIGIVILGAIGFWLVREWRRPGVHRRQQEAENGFDRSG